MFFPIYLSVIVVVQNQSLSINNIVSGIISCIESRVSDFEIILIDNASSDNSIDVFKKMTAESGFPNLQIYALTKAVDVYTASWVGLENSLGDFVAVIDPLADDIEFLTEMLDFAVSGADVVFARNTLKPKYSFSYYFLHNIFHRLYKLFSGINLTEDAPLYRVLNKKVINFILRHPQPALTYRHLPASGGFSRANLNYISAQKIFSSRGLRDSIDLGVRLLVSTTRGPMRLLTFLSLFGAFANLLYSCYVIVVGILKADITPGWVSLSLQQSGMFFLISLVLLVLGEYILQMASLSNEGPNYYVGQEFTSAIVTRREKLNIEEVRTNSLDLHPRALDGAP